MEEEKQYRLLVTLNEEQKGIVDMLAKKRGQTRAAIIRLAIEVAWQEYWKAKTSKTPIAPVIDYGTNEEVHNPVKELVGEKMEMVSEPKRKFSEGYHEARASNFRPGFMNMASELQPRPDRQAKAIADMQKPVTEAGDDGENIIE
jgi:hypothetical protein